MSRFLNLDDFEETEEIKVKDIEQAFYRSSKSTIINLVLYTGERIISAPATQEKINTYAYYELTAFQNWLPFSFKFFKDYDVDNENE